MQFSLSIFVTMFTLIPSLGFAQNELPDYQSVAERQVCWDAPVFDRPGGVQIAQATAGDAIVIKDVSFGPDGGLFFQFGGAGGPRFIASKDVAHFCGFAQRNAAKPIAFLAPPNTCHVIAASRRTLVEANAFAASYPDHGAVMNVFRLL